MQVVATTFKDAAVMPSAVGDVAVLDCLTGLGRGASKPLWTKERFSNRSAIVHNVYNSYLTIVGFFACC